MGSSFILFHKYLTLLPAQLMKIGITGHTQGIGLSLAKIFNANSYTVLGFSRKAGYDISEADARSRIVQESQDCDIFVNNAYHETGQLEMLKDLIAVWEGQDKIIINLSSQVVYKNSSLIVGEHLVYKNSKIVLNDFINKYAGTIKILNVIPDLVNTDFYLATKIFDTSQGINSDNLARLIFGTVTNFNDLYIKELVIYKK